jgi:hypothetical protein
MSPRLNSRSRASSFVLSSGACKGSQFLKAAKPPASNASKAKDRNDITTKGKGLSPGDGLGGKEAPGKERGGRSMSYKCGNNAQLRCPHQLWLQFNSYLCAANRNRLKGTCLHSKRPRAALLQQLQPPLIELDVMTALLLPRPLRLSCSKRRSSFA